MSLSMTVFAPDLPRDLSGRWSAALARRGFRCELYPGFDPETWVGGFVPMSLGVPASVSAAERYGAEQVLAGCELDLEEVDPADREYGASRSAEVAAALGRATRAIQLRSAMGRTVVELRCMLLCAAALAEATDGVYYDPQDDVFAVGPAAFDHALAAADAYEAIPNLEPAEWELTPFPGWSEFDRWQDEALGQYEP